jgi:hypothetical protein
MHHLVSKCLAVVVEFDGAVLEYSDGTRTDIHGLWFVYCKIDEALG